MSTKTQNYNLTKDDATDFYNIDTVNGNLDIIDSKFKELNDKVGDTTELLAGDDLVEAVNLAFQSASDGKGKIETAITGVDDTVTIPTNPTFDQLATAISEIETGIDTRDATATYLDILSPKTAYVNNVLVTGGISSKVAATYSPSTTTQTIAASQYLSGAQTISPVTGTATTAKVLSGYTFSSANGIGLTGTIASKAATTYSPSTTTQTIASGQYLSGMQTISPVTGTATADKLLSGYTCSSANGINLVGTMTDMGTNTVTPSTTAQWGNGDLAVYLPSTGYYRAGTSANGGTEIRVPVSQLQNADGDLIASNIVSGVPIFGITGSAIVGKRSATGTATYSTVQMAFALPTGTSYNSFYVTIPKTSLSFTPSLIIAYQSYSGTTFMYTMFKSDGICSGVYALHGCMPSTASAGVQIYVYGSANINTTSYYYLPIQGYSSAYPTYTWLAIE